MYQPARFKVHDEAFIKDLIVREGFGALVSVRDSQPLINHLPFVFEKVPRRLISHMARANDHWKSFESKATVIFQGPHGYISPAWYEPKPDNVPTWNYAVVHITGTPKVLEGAEAYQVMKTMVQHFEAQVKTGWKLPEPAHPSILQLMKAIVVFEITDLQIDAKFKLSQNKTGLDHQSVVSSLEQTGLGVLTDLARLMRETNGK